MHLTQLQRPVLRGAGCQACGGVPTPPAHTLRKVQTTYWTAAFLLLTLIPTTQAQTCSCGVTPPGPPSNRTLDPYANAPDDLRPYSRFTKPHYEHYTKEVEYNGAARDTATVPPSAVTEVPIGFLGPVENHIDQALGLAMLRGSQMAIDEANARGGYCGKPFVLKVHNDGMLWGSSSNEIVKMTYDDKVWAMLGSISGDSTHIGLRVSLRTELPMVNSASTDPTIPETIIPWMLTSIQDDRVQGYTLARRIYTDLGLKRVALLRVNDRYGRFGVMKFRDASRRLGHPVVIEQKFFPGDMDFRRQLRVIQDSRVDGIVLWADSLPAGTILKQMREMGMKQRVFGSFRVLGPHLLSIAGAAAEGLEIVYPYDPNRDHPAWVAFQKNYRDKYNADVDAFSALGYDTMGLLLNTVCRAGLNRGAIRDALYGVENYKGVTGEMTFDPNAKNIAPLYLGTVKEGKLTFRRYTMEKPYASLKDSSVEYAGPPTADSNRLIGIFGKPSSAPPAPEGFRIVTIPSDQSWGKSSTELINLVYQGAVAIIATDRNAAHLAEQIAVKMSLPLIAISADRDLTAVNIPWIFRLEPNTEPAEAVRILVDAANRVGPNRGRIREYLGSTKFQSTGELR